ncbi:Protein kinase superfamily protein [Abeliophyllum distichum]|uniref:Protein kinase superfamily protein n=1 Tax=Abeliophyllum distichum TaxID=126358 RepID=A0ABD1NWL6_9LAMI
MRNIRLHFAFSIIFIILSHCAKYCKANDSCPPTFCGSITNISYPFRLRGDPENCGDPSYELACENNRTFLYLSSNRYYYVQSISYNNFSIRVLDPGLENISCDSYPINTPLSYYTSLEPYTLFYDMNTPIIYTSCEAPAKSHFYVDTSSCSKNISLQKYSYVVVGYVTFAVFEDSCRIDTMAWISNDFPIVANSTFSDIQDGLAYGFVILWYRVYCRECEAKKGYYCYYNDGSGTIGCEYEYRWCTILKPQCLWDILYELRVYCWEYRWTLEKIIGPILAARFFCGILFLFTLLAYKFKRRHLSMFDSIEEFLQSQNNLMPIRYTYRDLKNMTKNFKDKLGEGGYGTVFKGQLKSGPFAAIKLMGKSKASGQEFISEVATIGRIHHVHVVRLIGFCVEGPKRALVYEFMPNGSLEKYIFPQQVTVSLNYSKIFDIALGVAKGIDYLHRGCDMQILHFDIKPHNILLDNNFTPKISDFGLAKLYPTDESMVSLTAARGTMGYMAPEMFYRNIGRVSYKSDVYSFGMLLMEMASKRRNLNPFVENISQIYFPCWVHDRFSKGMEIDLGDASLDERIMVKKMTFVALWCIQMKPDDRPSMTKVIEMLEGDVEFLQLPPKPFLSAEEMPVQDSEIDLNDMEFPLLSGSLVVSEISPSTH